MTFSPPRSAITAITQALPCVITTGASHDLSTGSLVRIHVPQNYGMDELNNQIFIITVLSGTTFSLQYRQVPQNVDVDSRQFTAFTIPANPSFTAEVLSVGSGPTPLQNTPAQQITGEASSLLNDATVNLSI